jgi:hypothetical protein
MFREVRVAGEQREKSVVGTHKNLSAKEWSDLCFKWNFSGIAKNRGGSSISKLLSELLPMLSANKS